jgi:acyl CoA:acetate/3-ketoacid CoA transferase alpha subunit
MDGKTCALVPARRADAPFIRAWQADAAGNLAYRMTEQDFSKAMVMAPDLVTAEVERLVPVIPAEMGTNQAGQEQEDNHRVPRR